LDVHPTLSVQELKKYVQTKLERDTQIHVELNQIEIYANFNGERLSVLRNKDTIEELI
jgi:hypothetical protein